MTISELRIYPIKSLGGISVPEVVVEAKGFRHDRRFMLVDPGGMFMTQRTNHHMALIDVAIAQTPESGEKLRVWHRHYPDDVLELPLSASAQTEDKADPCDTMLVTVWDSTDIPALTVSDKADRWFSKVLETPCRLVYMPNTTHRAVDPAYAHHDEAVSFADGYPYLLIGQASLDYLNQRLPEPIGMIRFRPNIVVGGSSPNDEDAWAHFRAGGIDFYGVKPCARCVLTTIDPETGQQGKEPLRTLTTYRRWQKKILFGQNVLAKPANEPIVGTLCVGQPVDIVTRQEPWLAPPV